MYTSRILLLSAILLASCAAPASRHDSGNKFGIITSEGIVLATVDGMATGFTNADLARLIRAGVAKSYSIQSNVLRQVVMPRRQIFWHVTSRVRYPTAVISVRFVEDGKTVKSVFADTAAPGTNPDLIFMSEVARLARKVLPPPIL